jgi:nucleoid-associated protein YgaU
VRGPGAEAPAEKPAAIAPKAAPPAPKVASAPVQAPAPKPEAPQAAAEAVKKAPVEKRTVAKAEKKAVPKPVVVAAASPSAAPKAPGRLELAVNPWGEIFVDGQSRGVSPPMRTLEISPGSHTIEIRNSTFPSHVEKVVIKSGDAVRIRHRFK